MKSTVVLPGFLVWKFCGKAQFRIVSGDLPETMWKLCLSTKFSHQEIRWNYSIFRSVYVCKTCDSKMIKGKIHWQTFSNKPKIFELPPRRLEKILIARRLLFKKVNILLELIIKHITKVGLLEYVANCEAETKITI